MKSESTFGKGLTYCLGLFLSHAERTMENGKPMEAVIWFNGAADHLYDMEIPDFLPEKLREEMVSFRGKCIRWRLYDNPTVADQEWAVAMAKTFLREIDRQMGVDVVKGTFE